MQHPSETFRDPLILELIDKLENTSSPYEYMRMLTTFHEKMLIEGVKRVPPGTISDFVLFECFWGVDLNPQELIDQYKGFFPDGEDLGAIVSQYEQASSESKEIQISSFAQKLNEAWNRLSPHAFMKYFKEYHRHVWREGPANFNLNNLLSLILFERSVGFPLNYEEVVDAYREAQYGFVKLRIEGDERLSKEFEKELQYQLPGDPKPTGKAGMTIEPDWENYWEGFEGLSFFELKEKNLLPLYWYIHGSEKEFGAAYTGVALVENGKVLYYDRYPLGGGPFKVNDFTDPGFKRRTELVAEHIEKALKLVHPQIVQEQVLPLEKGAN